MPSGTQGASGRPYATERVCRVCHRPVMARPEESKNPNLSTGEIEVFVDAVEILNEAKTPPFVIEDDAEVTEAIRLKYRYLDLRRPRMQRLLSLRHGIMQAVQGFLNARRVSGSRDADSDEKHAGRRTGLSGAEPGESRPVLCACLNRRNCSSRC